MTIPLHTIAPPRALSRALPLVVLLAVTGCAAGQSPTAAPAPSAPVTTAPPATTAPAPTAVPVDWDDPVTTDLGNGWSLGPCDGDAPLVCFSHDGQGRGTAEIASFVLPDTLRDALESGRSPAQVLDLHAREYLDHFRDDRARGCGADYVFSADEPRAMTVDGLAAIKTAFTGGAAGGPTTERVVRWVALRDGHLVSVVLHATADGACAPGLGSDAAPADLVELEPLIDAAFTASPLPTA